MPAEAPTTVEAPFEDVTRGVLNAVREVEELAGRRILVRTAPRPEGPWSEARPVYTVPGLDQDRRLMTYAAKTHRSRGGSRALSPVAASVSRRIRTSRVARTGRIGSRTPWTAPTSRCFA